MSVTYKAPEWVLYIQSPKITNYIPFRQPRFITCQDLLSAFVLWFNCIFSDDGPAAYCAGTVGLASFYRFLCGSGQC